MLSTFTIKIKTEKGEREIYISPFLLQSKTRPDLKSGTINKIYFYDQLKDDQYDAAVEQDSYLKRVRTDKNVLNYGQDFEKYYLGSVYIDFETKHFWEWEGKPDGLSEQEAKLLGESFFDPEYEKRNVVIFTPTRPSDFNFEII